MNEKIEVNPFMGLVRRISPRTGEVVKDRPAPVRVAPNDGDDAEGENLGIQIWWSPNGHGRTTATATVDGITYNSIGNRKTALLKLVTLLALVGYDDRGWTAFGRTIFGNEVMELKHGDVMCHGSIVDGRPAWSDEPHPIPQDAQERALLKASAGKVCYHIHRDRTDGVEYPRHRITGEKLPRDREAQIARAIEINKTLEIKQGLLQKPQTAADLPHPDYMGSGTRRIGAYREEWD